LVLCHQLPQCHTPPFLRSVIACFSARPTNHLRPSHPPCPPQNVTSSLFLNVPHQSLCCVQAILGLGSSGCPLHPIQYNNNPPQPPFPFSPYTCSATNTSFIRLDCSVAFTIPLLLFRTTSTTSFPSIPFHSIPFPSDTSSPPSSLLPPPPSWTVGFACLFFLHRRP
jgi:hypothetical protein